MEVKQKVYFSADEFWPCYDISPANARWNDRTLELTDAEIADFSALMKEFERWQQRIDEGTAVE